MNRYIALPAAPGHEFHVEDQMSEVTITVKQTGAYVIEGEVTLLDHLGQPIPTTPGKRISLCRCGASATKPFCDGTHSRIGFLAAEKAQQEFDRRQNSEKNETR